MKQSFVILISFLLFTLQAGAQDKSPGIHVEDITHDFGQVVESEGPVTHAFAIQNTGDAPLVITRVTASCGCTTPVWTKEPIQPGMTGNVEITYNPKGRPGPFRKKVAVFSNGKKGSYSLYVKGNVVSKPTTPPITYPYSIGDLKLQTKTLSLNNVRPDERKEEKIKIKNESDAPIVIKSGKLPNYLRLNILPETLATGETGEITVSIDAPAVKKMGRITGELPLTVESVHSKGVNGKIDLAVNIIDNFSGLSATEKANAPIADISTTLLDFGVVEQKSGFLPVLGGKTSENITITNNGKSTLSIYSITSDNELIDISGGKKEIKPGASATYKVTIRPKEIKTKLEASVHVVCNDPNGPVRLIKVTAQK